MTGPVAARLADGRLHLQHGPIDLIITTAGSSDHVDAAEAAMQARFATVLDELVGDLDILRRPAEWGEAEGAGVLSVIGARMMRTTVALRDGDWATSMICVAGAVADTIADVAWQAAALERVIVNNGGDIAIRQGDAVAAGAVTVGVVDRVDRPALSGRLHVGADSGIGGVATSGVGGRSLSLGIADAVTVLAADATAADVVATLVANAVDLGEHPSIIRRPAAEVRDDTDLGTRRVVTDVGPLTGEEVEAALDAGLDRARQALGHPGGSARSCSRCAAGGASCAPQISAAWRYPPVSRPDSGEVGSGARPVAASATDCRVNPSRRSRMCSPADFQMVSSTHWPSWLHDPSWWGSPKSPRLIGPSTALRISLRRISCGALART